MAYSQTTTMVNGIIDHKLPYDTHNTYDVIFFHEPIHTTVACDPVIVTQWISNIESSNRQFLHNHRPRVCIQGEKMSVISGANITLAFDALEAVKKRFFTLDEYAFYIKYVPVATTGFLDMMINLYELSGNGRRLLDANSDTQSKYNKCSKHFTSYDGIHQLHIFIFVLAIFHVLWSLITLALGRAKMRKWKARETEHSNISTHTKVKEANKEAYDLPKFMALGDTLAYSVQFYHLVPRILEKCKHFLNVFQPSWEVEGIKPGFEQAIEFGPISTATSPRESRFLFTV
ncbi:hypothetical protein OROMI_009943 [Orobanche minor]